MSAKIPAHVREQQINDLPNISFVRWADTYKNNESKAICRCTVDGFEWVASVKDLVNGRGCPQCGGQRKWTSEEQITKINTKPNITFVKWEGAYKGVHTKAVCRCEIDGFEWAASASSLLRGHGCPECAKVRRYTADESVLKINAKPNITFVRWEGVYTGVRTKAVCRCEIDGFEWAVSMNHLQSGRGCPQCAKNRRWTANERILQINALPNISFVRWADRYTGARSKAICRCAIDGHEWCARASHIISGASGCPQCSKHGFNPAAPGTLYILRSECGSMVKIGISNNHEQRHAQLRRRTPFDWNCIEMLHSDDGSLIAEWENELHSFTEPATFRETFDGYTEWRKWDDRLPMWLKRYRARLERYNKAP